MQSLKLLPCFIVGLLLLDQAIAATIHGTIYDLSLKKINNARVEINTAPKQFLIAQNGSYLFTVPNGAYTIKAQLMQKSTVISYVEENITIRQDGSYVLDLILFPDIEEGIEDIDIEVNGDIIGIDEKGNIWIIFIICCTSLISGSFWVACADTLGFASFCKIFFLTK